MSKTKRNLNKEILALFSGQSSVVTIPKLYIELTGSHSLALVLNQCVYWSNKSHCKYGYFYKEYDEWFNETHIPERTLRRRFDSLENSGWITTKVKKVKGVNTKHIQPHMNKIIESISNMLDIECPERPHLSANTYSLNNCQLEDKSICTNNAPTGQSGRSETATLADSSIYTDKYNQLNTTKLQSSSSFFFSETLDQSLLSQKLFRDERTDEEFMDQVINHVENHSDKAYSRLVRAQGALKLLTKLKKDGIIFYAKGSQPNEITVPKSVKSKPEGPLNQEELSLINEYNSAMKYHDIDPNRINLFLSKEKQKLAQDLIATANALYAKESPPCPNQSQSNNVRKSSLASVSNLVSHLRLSPHAS